jgi:CTP:molybdopterin cytidylyltransferase MocA
VTAPPAGAGRAAATPVGNRAGAVPPAAAARAAGDRPGDVSPEAAAGAVAAPEGERSAVVAGVVLAAGGGSRMGRPKALIRFGGELLVERACRVLAEGGCAPVLVVLGAGADEVLATAALPPAVVPVRNPAWAAGMGSSLRAGLAALPEEAAAVVVALVDTPHVGAAAVGRLLDAWRAGAVAAQATYGGEPGHPVLLSRSVVADVAAAATGDRGARAWLRTHAHAVVPVPCDGTGYPADLDTPDDLAVALEGSPRSAAGEE